MRTSPRVWGFHGGPLVGIDGRLEALDALEGATTKAIANDLNDALDHVEPGGGGGGEEEMAAAVPLQPADHREHLWAP